jgi:hypothetical protein
MANNKNIYECMKQGIVKDVNGNYYPDVLTTNIENLTVTSNYIYHILTERDILRFDLLMYRIYGKPYYDDIILLINNVYKNDLEVGDTLLMPSVFDMDTYFNNSRKVNL